MIKNSKEERVTPRIKAQDMIMDALADLQGYWFEKYEEDYQAMTKREQFLVMKQLAKICDRIARRFNFKKSWKS